MAKTTAIRTLAIVLILLALLGGSLGYMLYNNSQNEAKELQTTTTAIPQPPSCEAGWAAEKTVVYSDVGNIFISKPLGNGSIEVLESFIYVLQAGGFLNETPSINTIKSVLSSSEALSYLANQSSITVRQITSKDKGYKVLLPEANSTECIQAAVKTLYPGYWRNISALYLGQRTVPVNDSSWIYYEKKLPAWEIFLDRKPLSIIWIDPENGLVVAEMTEKGIYVWARIVLHP
jgi:hypothetical protein